MATSLRLSMCALAAMALAACGEPAPEARPDSPAAPDAAIPAPQPSPAPTPDPAPSPTPEEPALIPAAFRGVWAATTAECRKPAETRLEITADHLRFYESSGEVASVESASPTEIVVIVALSGEGALSQRSFRYRLLEGGEALFDVRNGLMRRRCAAA